MTKMIKHDNIDVIELILSTTEMINHVVIYMDRPIDIISLYIVLYKKGNCEVLKYRIIDLIHKGFNDGYYLFDSEILKMEWINAVANYNFTNIFDIDSRILFIERYLSYLNNDYYGYIQNENDNKLLKDIEKIWNCIRFTNKLENYNPEDDSSITAMETEYKIRTTDIYPYAIFSFDPNIYKSHQIDIYTKVHDLICTINYKNNYRFLKFINNIYPHVCLKCGYYKYYPLRDENNKLLFKHKGICVNCLCQKRKNYINKNKEIIIPLETEFEHNFNIVFARTILNLKEEIIPKMYKYGVVLNK